MSATMSSTPLQLVRRPRAGAARDRPRRVARRRAHARRERRFLAPPRTPPLALLIAFVAPIASAVIA